MDDRLRKRIAELLLGGTDIAAASTIIHCRFSDVLAVREEIKQAEEDDNRRRKAVAAVKTEKGRIPSAKAVDRQAEKIYEKVLEKNAEQAKHVKPERKSHLGPASTPRVYHIEEVLEEIKADDYSA